jgi:cardiolipin synthase
MVNVPNIITAFRAFMIPAFIIAIFYRNFELATWIFLLAAVSDAVDGFLARKLNQVTTIGVILDPIVDKLLINSAFVMLSYIDKIIPVWLTILVLSRDVLIIVGGWLLTVFGKVKRIKPSILGKLTAFFQFFTVFITLISLNFRVPAEFLKGLYLTTAAFTVASAVGYTVKGIRELSNEEIPE